VARETNWDAPGARLTVLSGWSKFAPAVPTPFQKLL